MCYLLELLHVSGDWLPEAVQEHQYVDIDVIDVVSQEAGD
jgi:hypothetical protein